LFETAKQAVIREVQTKSVYLKSKISVEVSTVEQTVLIISCRIHILLICFHKI
jgi:hypothetical protein